MSKIFALNGRALVDTSTGKLFTGVSIAITEVTDASSLSTLLSNPENIGKVYKYIGATTSEYKNGRYYTCENSEEEVKILLDRFTIDTDATELNWV